MIVWRRMRGGNGWRRAALGMVGGTIFLTGCQSPWIQCTIVNHEPSPVSLVEINYPGGSFGVQTIPAGGSYKYRFHALGSDKVSIDFTDSRNRNHTVDGPELLLGQEGTLQIAIEADNRVAWTPVLKKAH
jgi:hypothetical protein